MENYQRYSNFVSNRTQGDSLGNVIKRLINQYGIGEKLNEAKIIACWEEVVGKMIARHTSKLYVRKNKLYIKLDSAPLKNEILYARSKLLETIREKTESTLIDEIVIL
jgi:predicted nucleic acid-binding Zn ribbon protein